MWSTPSHTTNDNSNDRAGAKGQTSELWQPDKPYDEVAVDTPATSPIIYPASQTEVEKVEGNITGKVYTTEQLYDEIGGAYEVAYANNEAQLKSIEWVLAQLPKVKSSPNTKSSLLATNAPGSDNNQPCLILDIGCGTGRPVCKKFAEAGHQVLGVNISSAMIDLARQNVPHPNANFRHVDLRDFLAESASDTFDAITAYFSFADGQTQKQIKYQFSEVYRLLKPGGLFAFATVPSNADAEIKMWMGRKAVVSSLPSASAVQSIKEAGFLVEYKTVVMFTPKAAKAGLVGEEVSVEEPQLFVYARKEDFGCAVATKPTSRTDGPAVDAALELALA